MQAFIESTWHLGGGNSRVYPTQSNIQEGNKTPEQTTIRSLGLQNPGQKSDFGNQTGIAQN